MQAMYVKTNNNTAGIKDKPYNVTEVNNDTKYFNK